MSVLKYKDKDGKIKTLRPYSLKDMYHLDVENTDDYVSLEVTPRGELDEQSLSVSTTIQSVANASEDNKGLSEASDVKSYVDSEISKAKSDIIGGAPQTYDTLKEIAEYIEDHKSVETALNAAIGGKMDKNATIPYSQLSGTPTIPTNNNQLTNGAGYITSSGSISGNAATATNASQLGGIAAANYQTKRSVASVTTSGALSIAGATYNVYYIALNGNVSGITCASYPPKGEETTIIMYGNGAQRSISIANSGVYHTPTGATVTITVPATGYAEVSLLYDGSNVWVRGV